MTHERVLPFVSLHIFFKQQSLKAKLSSNKRSSWVPCGEAAKLFETSLIMYPQKRLSLWVPGPLCMPHFLRRQLASFLGWAFGVLRLTFQLKQMRVGKGQWCPTATGGMKFGTFGGLQEQSEEKKTIVKEIRRSQWHLWFYDIYIHIIWLWTFDRWFWIFDKPQDQKTQLPTSMCLFLTHKSTAGTGRWCFCATPKVTKIRVRLRTSVEWLLWDLGF